MATDFVALFAILDAARVRYVVVGGLAMLLHGIDRLTADVDLVVDLSTDSVRDTVRALTEAGYRPLAPVDPLELADPERRAAWRAERGMQVFSFWDTRQSRPTVDIMLDAPVPFEELWESAATMPIAGHSVRVASVEHLIRTKQAAGRPKDLEDVQRLQALRPTRG